MESPEIESRWGRHFPDRPWGAFSLCTTATGSLPGVKRPGHGVAHPYQSSGDVKERVELYLCHSSVPSWQDKE